MPYVARPYLSDPPDLPVWRYMNLEKLLSILSNQALFFPSVTTLIRSDRYEGQPTPAEIADSGLTITDAREIDKYNASDIASLFFNCWHMNDSESDAMWKIYVTGTGGVAIRSNISRLKSCFQHSLEDIGLGRIMYIGDDHIGDKFFDHLAQRFMRKRLAFRHEQEIRLMYYDDSKKRSALPGVLIPIDVKVLIEKIVVSPTSEDWFRPLVRNIIAKLGYDLDVITSDASTPALL